MNVRVGYGVLSLLFAIMATACSGAATPRPETTNADAFPDLPFTVKEIAPEDSLRDGDRPSDITETWVFQRDDYDPVHGWILLDPNPEAVKESIELAAEFGVNHIQLSHGLIMNVEDVLGSGAEIEQRTATLNMGIELAHQHGMKAYVWTHEFSGTDLDVCFGPEGEVWQERTDAYRQMFEILPDLDGVILMYGSAPAPPWFAICMCDWCLDNYDDLPLFIPPAEERLELVTEQIGKVVVNELDRELFVRTFVHEPAEIAWHSEGLASTAAVKFTGMHKGPVQDWQPYNPHHPCIGNVGDHPSVMELDLAGEYYGLSELPFAAPGYYWYRLQNLWQNKGIGVVARVQRGSHHALGTPNEINLLAVRRLVENPHSSLDSIWEEFLTQGYGLSPDSPDLKLLQGILENTFPIRRKSHYVLGIWALEKGSDLPGDTKLGEFYDRGKMHKWDPDWEGVWNDLDLPDKGTVLKIWQEGTEAVVLAEDSLARFQALSTLPEQHQQDLGRRLMHQWYAARAWRAIELYIWSARANAKGDDFSESPAWRRWAYEELGEIASTMEADGLADVSLASPARINQFRNAVAGGVPQNVEAAAPDELLFSPARATQTTSTSATISFTANRDTTVTVDYGVEIPDYGQSLNVGPVQAGEEVEVELPNLEPGNRYVFRLRAQWAGADYLGGDFWLFTPME